MTKQSSHPDNHKPSQYINGFVEFYKLKFKVTPDVLIPRPETELLVDEVIRHARGRLARLEPLTILDLGTGTGNIAISLAKNLASHLGSGNVKIIATDISKKALKVAQQNAKFHRVSDKITFIQSNLLQNIPRSLVKLSTPTIIVTNLPYIPSYRIPYLDSSVKDFEPLVALDGGDDGFDLYRKLFRQIKSLGVYSTHPGGVVHSHLGNLKLIVCEIDYTHKDIALKEAQKLVVSEVEPYFPQAQVEVKTDLARKLRILKIILLKKENQ